MILAIDTCGPVIGVATAQGVRTERIQRGGERRLVPWVLELLGDARPDAIGVAVGPGAFTGLRVGLATAQGLAHAYDVPLYGWSSLRTRAEHANADAAWLDARKGRVYAARGPGFQELDVDPQQAVFAGTFTGEGALVYRELIEAAGGTVLPDADDPGLPAMVRRTAGALEAGLDPGVVAPVYVRAPDAVPPRRGI